MIKLSVNIKPFYYDDLNKEYSVSSKFILSDEASSTSAIRMIIDALVLNGYLKSSIVNSMEELIKDLKETIKVEGKCVDDEEI